MKIKISPIFYQGCKKKLIKKGLIDLFPKDIDTFYDMCAGSAIVSMNTNANAYVVNDISTQLWGYYNMFKKHSADEIIDYIVRTINDFGLRRKSISNNDEHREEHKKQYMALRDFANANKQIILYYICAFYSFSQQMRFNSKGEFNMPCGNNAFTAENEEFIRQGCEFFGKDNVSLWNGDFRDVVRYRRFNCNDFVYFDTPYLDTTATYNENGGWSVRDEESLYKALEALDKQGIKWGLSNSFSSKGKENTMLINWCKDKGWKVYHFDIKYSCMGKGNANNDEVYICNY